MQIVSVGYSLHKMSVRFSEKNISGSMSSAKIFIQSGKRYTAVIIFVDAYNTPSGSGRRLTVVCLSVGPRQTKECLRACAKSADSRYPAHAQSLIRAFAIH